MAGTNDFTEYCPTDTGTNLDTLVEYAADTNRISGNKPGIASSKVNNRALRQANAITAALAQMMANTTGDNVLDDANQASLLATMAKLFTKSPTYTKLTSGSGTYTPGAGIQWLKVRMWGGGAGGSGDSLDGGAGGNTTFGTALLVANGGGTVTKNIGGTASVSAPAIGTAVKGADAGPAMVVGWGGKGAGTGLADGPPGGHAGVVPIFPPANTGVGGSGADAFSTTTGFGGGAGGYVEAIIPAALAANYAYAVGAAGASGFTNSNGTNGSSGYIEIEEHYN